MALRSRVLCWPLCKFVLQSTGPIITDRTLSPFHTRTFTTTLTHLARRPPFTYPSFTMSAISDTEIISRFGALKIQAPEIIQHAPVQSGAEWKAELEKLGKGAIGLTKTVSDGSFNSELHLLNYTVSAKDLLTENSAPF
jgi:hypothetical protein